MCYCVVVIGVCCVVLCCVVLCCVVLSYVVFCRSYCVVLCCVVLCCVVLCCVVLCCVVLCCVALRCAVLCCIVLCYVVLCCAVLCYVGLCLFWFVLHVIPYLSFVVPFYPLAFFSFQSSIYSILLCPILSSSFYDFELVAICKFAEHLTGYDKTTQVVQLCSDDRKSIPNHVKRGNGHLIDSYLKRELLQTIYVRICAMQDKFPFRYFSHCYFKRVSYTARGVVSYGARAAEREGQRGQFAAGPQGPWGLINIEFLFKASLDVFKNLPIGGAWNVLRVPLDSVPLDSLTFCPLCLLRSQTQGASLAGLPLGLENLSAALYGARQEEWLFNPKTESN